MSATDGAAWRRLEIPDPAAMSPAQRAIHESHLERFGALIGPRAPLLLAPELYEPWAQLGERLHASSLPADVRETAILATARFWGAEFVWWAHERRAITAGVQPAVLAAIRAGERPDAAPEPLRGVVEFCTRLLGEHSVGDGLYDRLRTHLGQQGLVELTALVGHYTAVALSLLANDAPPPPTTTEGDRSVHE